MTFAGRGILSPLCLPIPPLRLLADVPAPADVKNIPQKIRCSTVYDCYHADVYMITSDCILFSGPDGSA